MLHSGMKLFSAGTRSPVIQFSPLTCLPKASYIPNFFMLSRNNLYCIYITILSLLEQHRISNIVFNMRLQLLLSLAAPMTLILAVRATGTNEITSSPALF